MPKSISGLLESGNELCLSLAYDIITKGHGGTLTVESTECLGSEFIIILPVKTPCWRLPCDLNVAFYGQLPILLETPAWRLYRSSSVMIAFNQISKNNTVGSSINSLTFTKKVTEVEPSMMR